MTQLSEIDRQVERHLDEKDVRYTQGRRQVVRALHRSAGPQAASELHRGLRSSVPLSSLYRSLAVLDASGVLQKHHDAAGLARFELAEWLTGHHHHLVCVDCNQVVDVELDAESERALAVLAESAGRERGYAVVDHGLEIEGTCARCLDR
ncbi:MAG TPA: Fur family transcriptional regulator [Acidimicrobiia bacterium]|jgi:Fe2+ or Zn2+ uptake regulation protein|nr:Fur family transcriptional regulator [Acidimicrobiia bacterium]